jgi:hypothetical protein
MVKKIVFLLLLLFLLLGGGEICWGKMVPPTGPPPLEETAAEVPEPATLTLMVPALVGFFAVFSRKKNKK